MKFAMSPENSHKQGRLNEEVRRALSQIITEVKDPRIPAMPTIVNVKVAGDLSHATVFISFLDSYNETEVRRGLKAASGFIRKRLGEVLSLRAVPELSFVLDDSMEHGAKIDRILREIGAGEPEGK